VVVHDSRSGEASTLALDETGGRILERLMSPAAVSRLQNELPDVSPPELERRVVFLEERGLIFRDGEHLLGLPTEAKTESYVARSWPMEKLIAAFTG
jgi:hypothetical protein